MGQQQNKLSNAERADHQRCAINSVLFVNAIGFIVNGGLMMLYASDVLGYSPKQIAFITAVAPIFGLFRLPCLPLIRRFPETTVMIASTVARLAAVLVLILLPASVLTFPFYAGIVLIFVGVQQVGTGTVWQPMLREITTSSDRGLFFGRLRFSFTCVAAVTTGVISIYIGPELSEREYKIILAAANLGLLNQLFWCVRLARQRSRPRHNHVEAARSRVLQVLKRSELLRRPLFIATLVSMCNLPIFLVYLRQSLGLPSNILSFYALMLTIGGALSFLLWGRVADAIGFRPMLIGLLWLAIGMAPMLLFIHPLPDDQMEWRQLTGDAALSVLILVLYGLLQGILVAGQGIATTSIQHFHVRRKDSLEALNLYQTATILVNATVAFVAGVFLEDVVIPGEQLTLLGGVLHVDWMKAYLVAGVPIISLLIMWQTSRLPNARPHFGVNDFFGSIFSSPVRSLYAQRRLYDEDEDKRAELAHWMGEHTNPMNQEPLIEMLEDPSYDVKTEAIRSLARTRSATAGEHLLAMLKNPEKRHLADHLCWALGQLKYEPAVDELLIRLSPSFADRIRAMAARALGQIGAPEAIEPLANVLKTEENSLHLLSSATRALLQLEASEEIHAELVFDALNRLTDRDERYELITVLCIFTDCPTEWLLRKTDADTVWATLDAAIERQSSAWQCARTDVIQDFRQRDPERIRQRLKADGDDPLRTQSVIVAMEKSLARAGQWTVVSVLASAWLLYVAAEVEHRNPSLNDR